jgi:hypothetical protein
VRQESLKESKHYFETLYKSFVSSADLFIYFMERGTHLLRDGGIYSIIVSSGILRAAYGATLRTLLQSHFRVDAITDFGGLAVFADAKDTYVCIPSISKRPPALSVSISKVSQLPSANNEPLVLDRSYSVPITQLSTTAWSIDPPDQQRLFDRLMKTGVPLGTFVDRKFFSGVKTGFNDAFVIDADAAERLADTKVAKNIIHRFVGGEDIRTYLVEPSDKQMIVVPCGWTKSSAADDTLTANAAWKHFSTTLPAVARHLRAFEANLAKRQDQGDFWWELRPCDYYDYFAKPKIIFPDICKNPRFHLDTSGVYLTNTAYCLGTDDKRLLGFLNSRLFWFLIAGISIPFGVRAGSFRYRLIYQYMEHVPIALGNARAEEASLIACVDRMLSLHTQLQSAKLPQQQDQFKRQIDSTDRQIDQLVYQLYCLSEEEVKIVEQATA